MFLCSVTLFGHVEKKWNFSKIYSITNRTMKWQKNKIFTNKSIKLNFFFPSRVIIMEWEMDESMFCVKIPVSGDSFECYFCFVFFFSCRPWMPFEFHFYLFCLCIGFFVVWCEQREFGSSRLNGATCQWNSVQCDALCFKRSEGHCL